MFNYTKDALGELRPVMCETSLNMVSLLCVSAEINCSIRRRNPHVYIGGPHVEGSVMSGEIHDENKFFHRLFNIGHT
jgi:hypothetical protein